MPGAAFAGNGFGKLTGSIQIEEMGDIEAPILLTSTTSVPRVADALTSYVLTFPGNEDTLSSPSGAQRKKGSHPLTVRIVVESGVRARIYKL